jgi:hypothetical protein
LVGSSVDFHPVTIVTTKGRKAATRDETETLIAMARDH